MNGFVWILDALNATAVKVGPSSVSWAELLGDVSGAACVWLVARQHVWNWPLGLINNLFWSVLFWHAMLYADALLQGAFFALGVFGWWKWVHGGSGHARKLRVRRTTAREWAVLGLLTCVVTTAVAFVLSRYTPSPAPLPDASILTLSLAATYGQAQKLLESWWLWIVVDVISVPLYVSRGLYPTAALYVVFGCLCIKGLRDWHADLRERRAQA